MGSIAQCRNEGIVMKHRINLVHVVLLLGPILLAIIILPLSFGLNRTRSDVCAQPSGQYIWTNGCR